MLCIELNLLVYGYLNAKHSIYVPNNKYSVIMLKFNRIFFSNFSLLKNVYFLLHYFYVISHYEIKC